MPKLSGRYSICDEARRAPNNVHPASDRSLQRWGARGECGHYDDLREARDFAAAIWSSQEGRHTVVIRDDDRDGAIVESRSRLSWWRLFRNDARTRRRAIQRAVGRSASTSWTWLHTRWTITNTLTLMAIIVAIVGLFLRSKK